jgi:hypothetical protein
MTNQYGRRRPGRVYEGQCGPDEVMLEQRVAGSFLEFSLSHPARSEEPLFTNRDDHVVSVTATSCS